MITTKLTDKEFFTSKVDSSIPELASLPALAENGDFASAHKIFADYVRNTLNPENYLAGEKEYLQPYADKVKAAAERAMGRTFISCRVPHTFTGEIDWEFNPTYNGYKEWPWQFNRHPEWKYMADYYLLTGDEKAAAEWSAQFISWAKQAQVPENASGFETVCWRTLETGLRMKPWSHCIHAFLHSPSVSDEVITIFFKSVWEHGWRLRNFNTMCNWLISEMLGLTIIGLICPFLKDSTEWLAFADERMKTELDNQVYPDGMQIELSMGYHSVVTQEYENLLSVYRKVIKPAPAYLEEALEKLYSVYPKLARPDLQCPAMNDGGAWLPDDLMEKACELYPEHPLFPYFATGRKEGNAPEFKSILMEYGGAAIMRSGWDADSYWAYMDCSPYGRAHQHEDKLNLQIFALGHELVCESEHFDYDTSEMRKYVLSTRGHNTIRVDGEDQGSRHYYVWLPEMVRQKADVYWNSNENRDTAEASFTAGYSKERIPVIHTRRLIFLKNEQDLPPMFVAIDRLTSENDEKHDYEVIWHLYDNPTTIDKNTVNNVYDDGVGITVASSIGGINVVRGQKAPVFQGWLPNFGIGDVEHYPIPTILNTGVFEKSRRIVTVLCPFADNAPIVKSVEASGDIAEKTFTVKLADGREVTVEE